MGTLADLLDQDQGALAGLVAEEERLAWEEYRWEQAPLAFPVRGLGWVEGGRLLGYAALDGSGRLLCVPRLFASRRARVEEVECALLSAAIQGALESPGVDGVQVRLLNLAPPTTDLVLEHWKAHARAEGLLEVAWTSGGRPAGVPLEPWTSGALPAAASLLVSMGGARAPVLDHLPDPEAGLVQVLEACVRGNAWGTFEPRASFVVPGVPGEGLRGFVLATRMGSVRGHVAELAVAPAWRGRGLGRALMVRALDALKDLGCPATHLMVGLDNQPALALYRRLGFVLVRRFANLRIRKGA